MQDQNMQNLEPVRLIEEKTTESAPKKVPESCATEVEEVREIIDVVEKTENVTTEAAITTPEVGLGMDGGDMINRVLPEGEGSIDRRMQFIPVTPPVQETKDSLKAHGNSTMPFFDSASGHILGRKVPPPVPPKGMRNGFSEEDRSMQDMDTSVEWSASEETYDLLVPKDLFIALYKDVGLLYCTDGTKPQRQTGLERIS
ncbi:Hypothetical predicted protein [Mytilus galloprovincialis]|uniref:Uncharacterized protein n=1 Tax=Mytilus galloprovincialis TaxID=29158 RepID=A0A8B6EPK7_MYTGA|nr:Hypothetical predicted protein [Mytilus galloprovincialis]